MPRCVLKITVDHVPHHAYCGKDTMTNGMHACVMCGLLHAGGCGKGPNVVVQERGGERQADPIIVGHVATPSDAAEMLRLVCGVTVSSNDVVSVQARLQGNQMAQEGNLEGALAKYDEVGGMQKFHDAFCKAWNQ